MRDFNVIHGDLLNANVDYIVHQVNCQGRMGSGVAKAIRERHMTVYNKYVEEIEVYKHYGNPILGHSQLVEVMNGNPYKGVINMFAQDNYGYDGKQYTSIEALQKCLIELNRIAKGCSVAFPWKVGCVRGGADWDTVLDMICLELRDVKSITFYKLDLG